MAKIVTLGEIMLRLSTPVKERFIQSNSFTVHYGGSEANVSVSLSQYGHQAYFVSKVPQNDIGQGAINQLRQFGVHTNYVKKDGDRLGVYYLETGASMRPSKVIYDRAHSAISQATIDDFDFDQIFSESDWFHFSGITPALSKEAAELTMHALQTAKKHKVTVSVDLNYRKKLWTTEQAQKTMIPLMDYVDVCIGNEEDMSTVLGYPLKDTDVSKGKLNHEEYQTMFKHLKKQYNFDVIASTLRESISADHNKWSALLYDGQSFYQSLVYDIHIVDRVGAGDSFAGALIHGLLTKKKKNALDFAVAASALKHTIHGDFNLVTEQEVNELLQGNTRGRVQR